MSNTLTVVARLTATQDTANDVQEQLTRLVLESRAEKGCIRYILNRGVDDPNVFVLVEEWSNRDLWEAHRVGMAVTDFRSRIADDALVSSEVHALTNIA